MRLDKGPFPVTIQNGATEPLSLDENPGGDPDRSCLSTGVVRGGSGTCRCQSVGGWGALAELSKPEGCESLISSELKHPLIRGAAADGQAIESMARSRKPSKSS